MDLESVRDEAADSPLKRLYALAILILISGNASLAIAKGLLAWSTGSSAIFSDAANSLADTLYSILLGAGLYLAQKPADTSHPQGHSRFDPLISLFVTAAMAGAGAVALYESVQRFRGGGQQFALGLPTLVLAAAALAKVVMYKAVQRVGEEARSPSLNASAQDNLMDTLTTASAMIGVWGSRYVHPMLDPGAGILVALWIFRTTIKVGSESLGYLTGRGASREVIGEIVGKAQEVREVERVPRVIADYVGPRLRVEIHVEVDCRVTLEQAHDISEEVQTNVKTLPMVDLVFVHVDPCRKP